jgi:saccharopine dehydrogenase-like NADP-dependent oxidoreductase
MDHTDIVVNCVGPSFRFALPVLTAAIEAGCNYVDLCDDWEPALAMLELGEQAVASGTVAVIGMGASPGLTNLLALLAARELDTVATVMTGWNIEGATPEEVSAGPAMSAALVHGVRQTTGTIQIVRHGRPATEPALRRVALDYPGLGRRRGWTVGHPEPLTLARTFAGITSMNVAHTHTPGIVGAMKAMKWAVDHGRLSPESAARTIQWAEHHLPRATPRSMIGPHRRPPLYGLATGTHDGRGAEVGVALTRAPGSTMGALTGIPIAVAAILLVRGEIDTAGVHSPESILEPRAFFAPLAAFCPDQPEPDEMVSITRSWDPDPRSQFRASADDARRYLDKHLTRVHSPGTRSPTSRRR